MGLIAISVAIAPATRAIDNSWTNSNSGKWEDSANWSLGVAPSNTHAVFVTNAVSKTVTVDSMTSGSLPNSMTINSLTMSAAPSFNNTLLVTNAGITPLTINGQCTIATNSALVVTNSRFTVSGASTNRLAINGGSVRLDSGTMTISGGQLSVGALGEFIINGGRLNMSNGGVIGKMELVGGTIPSTSLGIGSTNPASPGSLWVKQGTLSASVDLATYGSYGQLIVSNGTVTLSLDPYGVGYVGEGTLGVAGGTVTITGALLIPSQSAWGTATVWVTGGHLIVPNYAVRIGSDHSKSTVIISNGSMVANSIEADQPSSSSTTFLMAGGTLSILGDFTVARGSSSGTTTVWVTGGQLVATNGATKIGDYGAGRIVQSNGSILARSFYIAESGHPFSTVSGRFDQMGGTNIVSSDLIIGDCGGSATGVLILAEGCLFVTNASHTAFVDVRGGTLTVNGGALVADRLVMTNSCGRFIKSGGSFMITTLQLDLALDADGDGLPNGWEQSHGLDPLNAADASADNDGDGLSNLQEYLAGTDPTNSASAFRITSVVRTDNDVLVTWATAGGRTNLVQSATDLTGSYINISANIVLPGSGDMTTNYLDAGGATNGASRYYRVRLVP